jgi:hypothetical protein
MPPPSVSGGLMLRALVTAAVVAFAGPALAEGPDSTTTDMPRRLRPTATAPT